MKIVIYFDCNGNRSLASAECGLLIKPAAAALPTVSNIQGRQARGAISGLAAVKDYMKLIMAFVISS